MREGVKNAGKQLVLASSAVTLFTATAAWGQSQPGIDTGQAPAPADPASTAQPAPTADQGLADIVVTAQKRTERLQDVPLSASVISGAALQAGGNTSLQSLTATIPSVNIVRAGPSDRLYVRGIGSGDNFSFDQSVATFVDGVYHGRSRSSGSGFLDLDRIEFLKGPQSIFFGNSAIGGAINVSTRKPTDQLSGDVSASYNIDWREVVLEGGVGGPITDTLSARVAGAFSTGDGWLYDAGTGERVPQTNNKGVRLALTWKPTDRLSVDLKGEVGRYRQRGGLLIQLANCPPAAGFPGPRGFCPNAIAQGVESRVDDRRASTPGQISNLDNQEYVLNASYDLGGPTLSAITAYLRHDYHYTLDLDGPQPADLFSGAVPEHYRQFSQELRLASGQGGAVDYIGGLYYQHDTLDTEQDLIYSFQTPVLAARPAFAALVPYLPLGQALAFRQSENIYSAFGSVTWHVAPRLRVAAGLRGTIVTKDADKSIYFGTGRSFTEGVTPFPTSVLALSKLVTNGIAPTTAASYHRTDRRLTPSVNVQFDVAHDVLAYASYSNGFKAGGFNGADTSADQGSIPFGPETVDAFEAGLKTQFLNRRMTLNIAAFRSTYHDLQVGGVRPVNASPVSTVQNAGGARSQGIEVEHRWIVAPGLTSNLSVVLLDAKYTRYPNANATSLQTVQGITQQDLSGARTPYSAKVSGSWALTYKVAVTSNLSLHIGDTLFFTSRYNTTTNNDPFLDQSGFVKLDATVGITSKAGWDLSLLVRNLTDANYIVYGAAAPTSLGSYSVQKDPPRSFTVRASHHF